MRRPEPRARATTVLSCRAQHAQTSTAPSRLFSRRRPWRSSAAPSESHWPPPGVGPEGRWGRSPSARSATGPSVLRFPPPAGRTGCSPAGLLCLIAVAAENLEAGLGSSQVNARPQRKAKSSQLLPLLKFPLHILRGGKKKRKSSVMDQRELDLYRTISRGWTRRHSPHTQENRHRWWIGMFSSTEWAGSSWEFLSL